MICLRQVLILKMNKIQIKIELGGFIMEHYTIDSIIAIYYLDIKINFVNFELFCFVYN